MRIIPATLGFALMFVAMHSAYAEQWVVRRQASNGECAVQRAHSYPGAYRQRLATFGTLQRACMEAVNRHQKKTAAAHGGQAQVCFDYASPSRSRCASAQVELPNG